MLIKCALALLLVSVWGELVGTDTVDVHESHPEKPASQKGRLSLQNTAEIQHCLVSAGDVGCGVFECFENNSCEIRGLQEICMTFLHNAGKFDSQGKSFIKDALKCMAHGLRHKFITVQRHKLPYVELVNILLSCGEEVKEAITRSVRLQCEQNWGALCDSLSICTSITAAPASGGLERRPALSSQSDAEHHKSARTGDKDKPGKVGFSSHTRSRSQGPRRASLEAGPAEQEHSKISDIRR
uniref:Stanniocalcin n=1 Tax=Sinocyclocheilus grahami TaxID=75366 RepID=A0A672MUY4_SINGR